MDHQEERTKGADVVRDTYAPKQDRSMSEAVLDAIEECKGDDLRRIDFVLFEDIDPQAFDNLFRRDAQPSTTVTIVTDGVQVDLWGEDGVEIRVADESVGEGRPEPSE